MDTQIRTHEATNPGTREIRDSLKSQMFTIPESQDTLNLAKHVPLMFEREHAVTPLLQPDPVRRRSTSLVRRQRSSATNLVRSCVCADRVFRIVCALPCFSRVGLGPDGDGSKVRHSL